LRSRAFIPVLAALFAPAGVPAEIVARLNEAILAVVSSADIQQNLKIQGVDPTPGPPAAVAARIRDDIVKWRDVVAAAKITGGQ